MFWTLGDMKYRFSRPLETIQDINDLANKQSCNCVKFQQPKSHYWFEFLLTSWSFLDSLAIICVVLIVFNICYLVIRWKSLKKQEKCPSYKDAIKHLDPKSGNDPVNPTQHSELSSVVVKC